MSSPLLPEDQSKPLASNQAEPDCFGEHVTNTIAYQLKRYQQNRFHIMTEHQGTERAEKLRFLGMITFGIDHPGCN